MLAKYDFKPLLSNGKIVCWQDKDTAITLSRKVSESDKLEGDIAIESNQFIFY